MLMTPAPPQEKLFPGTDEQNAIGHALLNKSIRNVAVNACAGSGKSFTGKQLIRHVVPQKQSVLVTAFNRMIVESWRDFEKEVADTGRRINVKNFNQLGMRLCAQGFGREVDIKLDDNKYADIAKEILTPLLPVTYDERTDEGREKKQVKGAIRTAALWAKMVRMRATFSSQDDWHLKCELDNEGDIVDFDFDNAGMYAAMSYMYGIASRTPLYEDDAGSDIDVILDNMPKIMQCGMDMKRGDSPVIDFVDQTFLPVYYASRNRTSWLPGYRFMWIIVDEAQDLCPCERSLIEMHTWRKQSKRIGRVVFIGDDAQSIYRFKGTDGWDNTRRFWQQPTDPQYKLSYSFRTPRVIEGLAISVKPDFKSARINSDGVMREAPLGSHVQLSEQRFMDWLTTDENWKRGVAIASRVRGGLVAWAVRLMAEGIPYSIAGADIANEMIELIEEIATWETFKLDELPRLVGMAYSAEINELESKNADERAIELVRDMAQATNHALKLTLKDTLTDTIQGIRDLFAGNSEDEQAVQIGTGHVFKGLEFQVVANVTPDRFPLSHPGMSEEDMEVEAYLKYVVETRTEDTYIEVWSVASKSCPQDIKDRGAAIIATDNDDWYAFAGIEKPVELPEPDLEPEPQPEPDIIALEAPTTSDNAGVDAYEIDLNAWADDGGNQAINDPINEPIGAASSNNTTSPDLPKANAKPVVDEPERTIQIGDHVRVTASTSGTVFEVKRFIGQDVHIWPVDDDDSFPTVMAPSALTPISFSPVGEQTDAAADAPQNDEADDDGFYIAAWHEDEHTDLAIASPPVTSLPDLPDTDADDEPQVIELDDVRRAIADKLSSLNVDELTAMRDAIEYVIAQKAS